MKCETFFRPRHLLKVFLLQLILFQQTSAAPSPIIKFPGDDSNPRSDKEVALVSLWLMSVRIFWKTCRVVFEYMQCDTVDIVLAAMTRYKYLFVFIKTDADVRSVRSELFVNYIVVCLKTRNYPETNKWILSY